jgi:hypothetical protein
MCRIDLASKRGAVSDYRTDAEEAEHERDSIGADDAASNAAQFPSEFALLKRVVRMRARFLVFVVVVLSQLFEFF